MENLSNQKMLEQVRTAHRLVVGYYKRLFQLLRDVTNGDDLQLEYLCWLPSNFSTPCRRTTNVFSGWEWDLLPGIATHYLFCHAKDIN